MERATSEVFIGFISIAIITIIGFFLNNLLLKIVKEKKQVQTINEYMVENHGGKQGTPTLGGLIFIILPLIYFLLSFIIGIKLTTTYSLLLVTIALFGYIGFIDDYHKIAGSKNEGLKPKQKLILQVAASVVVIYLSFTANIIDTKINLMGNQIELGFGYFIILVFALIGFSNATNLTDGLDGLLGFNFLITTIFMLILATTINIDSSLIMFLLVLIVGLGLFLTKNKYPAKIFMGDTGSLSLGPVMIMGLSIMKFDLAIIFFGFIYLIEVLSVILQVAYFKYTKKKNGVGKRLFLMTPIHHHFEKKGWHERKVVLIFIMINIFAAILFFLVK